MKQYFYIDSNNQQVGPINEDALMELVRCGDLSRQTLIWAEGLEGWLPYGDVLPESGEDASMPALDDELPIAEPSSEMSLKQRLLERMNRKHLIIGGAVALITVFSFSVYFVSECRDSADSVTSSVKSKTKPKKKKRAKISKEKAIEELRELGIVSSDADIKGVVGSLALADACKAKNIKVTELLIIAGADTKIVNEDCVLLDIIWDNQIELVKLLLAVPGIDVNISREDGHTPLSRAAQNGMADIVRLLLAAPGIDVNEGTALAVAVKANQKKVVKILLADPSIDVNKKGSNYGTPLAIAAEKGHTEIVKLLLSAPGININPSDAPLARAARNGHTEIVKLLLAAPSIDVNEGGL